MEYCMNLKETAREIYDLVTPPLRQIEAISASMFVWNVS